MQPIDNNMFRELCLKVANCDFTMNAQAKATYTFTDGQKQTLNLLLKLAKTGLFTEVKLITNAPDSHTNCDYFTDNHCTSNP